MVLRGQFDGYRTLALKDGSRIKLLSRNLKDATRQYPSVAREVARLQTESVILDGEVVAIDDQGRPSFQALHHQSAHTLVYYAFDVLHLDGRDLTAAPLDERRELLARVLNGSRLLRSEPLAGTPAQIEKAVRELHLEGVVAKRRNSRYDERCARAPLIRLFTPPAVDETALVGPTYVGRVTKLERNARADAVSRR
jgi:bifunctional non-homologous end joining protein LigD